MRLHFLRPLEVERHDVGSDVEPASTDHRYLLKRGIYPVTEQGPTYTWLKGNRRITYAIRRDMLERAVTAGAVAVLKSYEETQ